MTTPNLPGDPTPAGAAPLSGLIANRYRIERQIGEGGMATVYLAWDQTREIEVALKAPKPELVMQLGAERFAREIQISTKLQHPHIVPVLDAGFAADGVPFYVMPFIDGETLEQRLTRTGALPVDEAIQIACEMLDGLVYAHQLGFVHRDVKPSNVLLQHGHALLADFGIARAVERADNRKLTESGFALGTAEYMSPEQAAGDAQLDGRSDLYSVACVLYEMLVGGPPFTAPTARAVMARHFVDPVPSIRTVRDTVPVKLEQAVVTALAKTPVDRFADAAAFRAALRDPALREPTTGTPARTGAAQTRSRWRMAAIAAGVGVAAAAGLWWNATRADAAPLDANRVMVYPFALPSDFSGPRSTGEDVATLIGNALDVADPLKWIDGWSMLDPKTRDDIASLVPEFARKLAQQKRCATFITGRIVRRSGDSLSVQLTLYDVAGDSVLKRSEATGVGSDPWKQGLTAANGVLPKLILGGVTDVSAEWRNRAPGAVANFLLGEAAFRRLHMREALGFYRKSIDLDSTFAFAALRGAQAASWNHRAGEAQSLVRLALSQPLPPRYHAFALGIASYITGAADSAIAHLQDAVAADSDMTVAWVQLGEVYMHLLPREGDVQRLADAAFTRAWLNDTSAVNGLLHPIEIRLNRGDTAAAAPLIARYLAANPDSDYVAPLLIEMDCARRKGQVNWDSLARQTPLALLSAAKRLGANGSRLACARAAYTALLANDTGATDEADNRRSTAIMGLHAVALATGDIPLAESSLDRFVARWAYGSSSYLMDPPIAPALLPRARRVAQADSAAYGPNYAKLPFSVRLWKLGVFEAQSGRVDVAAAVAAELRRRGEPADSSETRVLAQSLDGFVQLARRDSAAAERSFAGVLASDATITRLSWDEAIPRGIERLTLAQLLLARGEHRQALDLASVFDSGWPMIYLQYLPASLELRARAAKSLGNSVAADHYLARLAALRGATSRTGG